MKDTLLIRRIVLTRIFSIIGIGIFLWRSVRQFGGDQHRNFPREDIEALTTFEGTAPVTRAAARTNSASATMSKTARSSKNIPCWLIKTARYPSSTLIS